MRTITKAEEFDAISRDSQAIIFKHSTRCPISSGAYRETERFLTSNPEAPLYKVLVVEDRPVSQHIAQRTGVNHASPQVIVLRGGEVFWHASHFDITADALAKTLSS